MYCRGTARGWQQHILESAYPCLSLRANSTAGTLQHMLVYGRARPSLRCGKLFFRFQCGIVFVFLLSISKALAACPSDQQRALEVPRVDLGTRLMQHLCLNETQHCNRTVIHHKYRCCTRVSSPCKPKFDRARLSVAPRSQTEETAAGSSTYTHLAQQQRQQQQNGDSYCQSWSLSPAAGTDTWGAHAVSRTGQKTLPYQHP
jgi:hypothetical protein